MELAVELVEWLVTLVDGNVLRLRADGYSEEGGSYVFTALIKGRPNVQLPLAVIPSEIVAKVRGG